jgi:hypothetical protein
MSYRSGLSNRRQRRRAACLSVLLGFCAYALLHIGFFVHLDKGSVRFRDPEFSRRLQALHKRRAEQPQAKLVLVLGSSRVAMGVRPGTLEKDESLLLFNMSLAGSGPIMELLAFRRTIAAGLVPDAVLIEYWPAFLRENGPYHEDARLDPARLNSLDSWIVECYFRPEHQANVDKQWRDRKLQPWYSHRKSLMNQIAPAWLPYGQRSEAIWEKIDDWGWLPGREAVTPEQAASAFQSAGTYYRPLFEQYEVSPDADRALRELIQDCRSRDIPLSLLYLPESAGFLAMMPPMAKQLATEHLKQLRQELNLPMIDARGWVRDEHLPDGFHLTQIGAEQLTQKLRLEVKLQFPDLSRSKR